MDVNTLHMQYIILHRENQTHFCVEGDLKVFKQAALSEHNSNK